MKRGVKLNAERLFGAMEQSKLDYILVCGSENVGYLSKVDFPIPLGATFEFGGGFPLAYVLVSREERKINLIVSNFYEELAGKNFTGDSVFVFQHYDHFKAINGSEELTRLLRYVLPHDGHNKTIGIEYRVLPALIHRMLIEDGFEMEDCIPVMSFARRIKTADEIERMKRSAFIEDCGQNRLMEYARNFSDETAFEVWAGVTAAMNKVAGERLEVSGELATGSDAQKPNYPGGPKDKPIFPGELGRMDISIRQNCYWSDCCNTVVFGKEPTVYQRDCFQIVLEAYEAAKEKLKPGNRLSDVNEAACQVYKKYSRTPVVYTGHQIGCAVNEFPRITCYEHDLLEPGMVVCIEPQQYGKEGSGIGVRLEKIIWISETGTQELNHFMWGM